MIDASVIERDARADIADWPTRIRHYYDLTHYQEAEVHTNTVNEVSVLQSGGLLDQMVVNVLAMAGDFDPLPQVRDRVDVEVRENSAIFDIRDMDGTLWRTMEVKRAPDYYDAGNPTFQLSLGTRNA